MNSRLYSAKEIGVRVCTPQQVVNRQTLTWNKAERPAEANRITRLTTNMDNTSMFTVDSSVENLSDDDLRFLFDSLARHNSFNAI